MFGTGDEELDDAREIGTVQEIPARRSIAPNLDRRLSRQLCLMYFMQNGRNQMRPARIKLVMASI